MKGEKTKHLWSTPEYREKTTAAMQAANRSPEYCRKMSERMKGRKLSQETKDKIGAANRKKQRKVRPDSAFQKVLHGYRARCKKKNIVWGLTDEQARVLTDGNCHYCGAAPSLISKTELGQQYVWNGIDRIDSTDGYTEPNSVPCCSYCNVMKSTKTKEAFLLQCVKVLLHSGIASLAA